MASRQEPQETTDLGDKLLLDTNEGNTLTGNPVIDSAWVKNSFMVSDSNLSDPSEKVNRYWSTARSKFTDTSVGGNIGINPWPQFTQYADIHEPGLYINRQDVSIPNTTGNYGMGRYYSEAIDDNKDVIYLRFGVPQHNSLGRFFSLAIDSNLASLANTGVERKLSAIVGKILGTVLLLVKAPMLAAVYWGMKGISTVVGVVTPNASSKYYTLKPTPLLYYSAVTNLFNMMAVNRGVLPAILMESNDQEVGTQLEVNQEMLDSLRELMPDIFTDKNYIDVYAIVGRAQRIANHRVDQELVDMGNGSSDFAGYVDSMRTETVNDPGGSSFEDLIKRTYDFDYEVYESGEESAIYQASKDPLAGPDGTTSSEEEHKKSGSTVSWVTAAREYYNSLRKDGADFVPLIVENSGTITESFSTSVKDSGVSSIINSTSEGARSMMFNLGGGNLGNNLVSEAVEGIVGSMVSIASNTLSTLTLGTSNIVAALLGGGYIDVPKQWDNSTVSLPKTTYTVQLVQPYGHPLSLLMHTDLVVCMLLGGMLPLATGKASYTSPFICELNHPGRQSIPLGVMDSLSISRGTTNLAFNNENKALGVTLTFSVVDLSSIMSMPISNGRIGLNMDDDNILSKYLDSMSGRSLSSSFYSKPAGRIRLAKTMFDAKKYNSPAGWAMWFDESVPGRIVNIFSARSDVIK